MNWLRSRVINRFRYYLHPNRTQDPGKIPHTLESLIETLHDYAHFYASVDTLFILIGFIESFYERLTSMIPELPKPILVSHPHAGERWIRLQRHCVFDIPISSGFNEYSKALLGEVLEYMSTLSSRSIADLAGCRRALKEGD